MPIGEPQAVQSLIKLTKHADGTTTREDLGAVRFVPLIGEYGFHDAGSEALVESVDETWPFGL